MIVIDRTPWGEVSHAAMLAGVARRALNDLEVDQTRAEMANREILTQDAKRRTDIYGREIDNRIRRDTEAAAADAKIRQREQLAREQMNRALGGGGGGALPSAGAGAGVIISHADANGENRPAPVDLSAVDERTQLATRDWLDQGMRDKALQHAAQKALDVAVRSGVYNIGDESELGLVAAMHAAAGNDPRQAQAVLLDVRKKYAEVEARQQALAAADAIEAEAAQMFDGDAAGSALARAVSEGIRTGQIDAQAGIAQLRQYAGERLQQQGETERNNADNAAKVDPVSQRRAQAPAVYQSIMDQTNGRANPKVVQGLVEQWVATGKMEDRPTVSPTGETKQTSVLETLEYKVQEAIVKNLREHYMAVRDTDEGADVKAEMDREMAKLRSLLTGGKQKPRTPEQAFEQFVAEHNRPPTEDEAAELDRLLGFGPKPEGTR